MKTVKNNFCKVAIENTAYSFDSLFTYIIPEKLKEDIVCGIQILVPFGNGNSLRNAVVFEVFENNPETESGKLKTVSRILEDLPVINEELLKLASFLKERYFCTYYNCIKTMLPPKFKSNVQKELKIICITKKGKEALSKETKLTQKQKDVLTLLGNAGDCSVKEINYFAGTTVSVAEGLIKKGFAEVRHEKIYKTPMCLLNTSKQRQEIILTEEQEIAYLNLLEKYKENKAKVSLLHGVTGSGKTSVFMKLIDIALQDGKSAIVMVPEIALTPQLVTKFVSYYGQQVAVVHSGLSVGERSDEYRRIAENKAKVVIGTRSAVFSPVKKLGLIVIDEEQEETYKSETSPRFSAQEVAKFRSVHNNCLLVLASATPSIKTYYHAKSGLYSLEKLKRRYGPAILPEVTVVDMNLERKLKSNFSNELLEAIDYNLENKLQTILLLNRRGHNTFITCKTCKEPVSCPNCSISLTFHSANNRLMCHYCGYSTAFSNKCSECSGEEFNFSGTGTQKAETELALIFPEARIMRMDADSTMKKNSHEELLSSFEKENYDILVGTQMVAKGLDFQNVTLVGVVNADQALYSDDYKSYERAFSLITQVVGRSGRGGKKGRAIIQTYTPENNVINLAANQDYETFYSGEIMLRKAMLYPPFADICIVGFVSVNQSLAMAAAADFLKNLTQKAKKDFSFLPLRVLGPSADLVTKVNNKYRYKLMIKCKNNKSFRTFLELLLKEFYSNKKCKDVSNYIDFI